MGRPPYVDGLEIGQDLNWTKRDDRDFDSFHCHAVFVQRLLEGLQRSVELRNGWPLPWSRRYPAKVDRRNEAPDYP
jgi:hypothetical protein